MQKRPVLIQINALKVGPKEWLARRWMGPPDKYVYFFIKEMEKLKWFQKQMSGRWPSIWESWIFWRQSLMGKHPWFWIFQPRVEGPTSRSLNELFLLRRRVRPIFFSLRPGNKVSRQLLRKRLNYFNLLARGTLDFSFVLKQTHVRFTRIYLSANNEGGGGGGDETHVTWFPLRDSCDTWGTHTRMLCIHEFQKVAKYGGIVAFSAHQYISYEGTYRQSVAYSNGVKSSRTSETRRVSVRQQAV